MLFRQADFLSFAAAARRICAARICCATVGLFSVGLFASNVAAKNIFLNGVNIDGVTQQKFENVSVEIDAEGNVLITAQGYEVQKMPARESDEPVVKEGGPVTRRYFLVSETNAPGMAEYDIDIFVNSVWVKRISHEDGQSVTEITRHMRGGKNRVHFTATKVSKGTRKSASAKDLLSVILGEGNMAGKNVTIENPLIEYQKSAAETETETREFRVVGR